jgi:hypothetical protein
MRQWDGSVHVKEATLARQRPYQGRANAIVLIFNFCFRFLQIEGES